MKNSLKVKYLGEMLLDIATPSMNPDDFGELKRLLKVLENHLASSPSEKD